MKLHYDSVNDHIYCSDAYTCKDILKSKGFRWMPDHRVWFMARPKSGMELGNLISELYIECEMDYLDLLDFMGLSLPAEISNAITMDETHLAKFQAATANV